MKLGTFFAYTIHHQSQTGIGASTRKNVQYIVKCLFFFLFKKRVLQKVNIVCARQGIILYAFPLTETLFLFYTPIQRAKLAFSEPK